MKKVVFSKAVLISSILRLVAGFLLISNHTYAIVIEEHGSDSTIVSNTVKPIQQGIGYARFTKGHCTEYAASRRPDIFPSRGGKDRLFGGNAIQWYSNARVAGLRTGKTPEVGAIAVYAKGRGASTIYGHVAIVEKVLDDHRIEITEMNYLGRNVVTRRIVKSNLALGYIYVIKDSKSLHTEYAGEDDFNNTKKYTNLAQTGVDAHSGIAVSYVINNNNQFDIAMSVGGSPSSDIQEQSHQYHSHTIVIDDSSKQTFHNPTGVLAPGGEIQYDGYTYHSYESVAINNAIFMGSMMELSG